MAPTYSKDAAVVLEALKGTVAVQEAPWYIESSIFLSASPLKDSLRALRGMG